MVLVNGRYLVRIITSLNFLTITQYLKNTLELTGPGSNILRIYNLKKICEIDSSKIKFVDTNPPDPF